METISATVSSRGYIVLPARLRKEMNIKAGTKILLSREENKIIMQPVTSFTQKLAGLTAQNFGTNPDEVKKYIDGERGRSMKTIAPSELKREIIGKKLLIDTNIIIYLTDAIQPYEPLSRLIFEMIETGDASAVLSIISVAEIMKGPINVGQHRNALDVKKYLLNFPNIFCQEITLGVLEHIGGNNLVDWTKLRTTDSLIIASGLENRVDLFVSNDAHFKKAFHEGLSLSLDAD